MCLLGALALTACQTRSDAPPPVAGRSAGHEPAVSKPADEPKQAAPLSLPAAEPADDHDDESAFHPGPLDYAAGTTGVLVVWTRTDGEHSDIFARRLDARGVELGAPRLIRRVDGELLDIAVATAGGRAHIAWISAIDSEPLDDRPDLPPRGEVFAVEVADDLSTMAAPLLVDRFTDSVLTLWGGKYLRLLAPSPDTAIIASLGATVNCRRMHRRGDSPCPGYHMFRLRSGAAIHVGQVGIDGGQTDMGTLVDVGAGFLLDVWGWHGGATYGEIFLPRDRDVAAAPRFPRVQCPPPVRRGFDGRNLVSLCADECGDDGAERACGSIHAVGLDGRLVTPRRAPNGAPVTGKLARCHQGRPVLEYTWEGGQHRLDPQAPGASLDLRAELGVWLGEYAVQIAPDGRLRRYRCSEDGQFVPAPADPQVHDLDLAAAPRERVPEQ